MRTRRSPVIFASLFLLLFAPVACGNDNSGQSDTLTLFAAASLTTAFGELGTAFEDANPDVTVEFNFAGSQALATQLIEGASADVFASADTVQMDRVDDAGLVSGQPVIFARNRLAVIVPAANPAGVRSVYDLGDPDLKLVLAADEVPAGRYAREMIANLAGSAEFQERNPGFSDFNVVSNETNVLHVVTRVRLGEADAGIVYETDVTPDVVGEVELIPIPFELNVLADYPIALISGGNSGLSREFIEFVQSSKGRRILDRWGFVPVEPA